MKTFVNFAAYIASFREVISMNICTYVGMRGVASAIHKSFIRELLYFIQFAKVSTRENFRLYDIIMYMMILMLGQNLMITGFVLHTKMLPYYNVLQEATMHEKINM